MPAESKFDGDCDVDEAQAKSDAQSALLKRAMAYCWSEAFLGQFRKYFKDNAGVFEEHAREHMNLSKTEDVVVPTVEHELSHHQCFTEYLEMFDSSLDGFLEEEGSDGPEFFQQLEECMEKPDITPEESLFIKCLLASADYDSFYSVMVKEAKNLILMKNAGKIYEGPNVGGAGESKGGELEDDEDFEEIEAKDSRK
ncbi:hypothetical protein TrCOL_g8642 [Triparma columacea]|uniref:Cilia- and flagella-associated protein 36 n=1 Tax=Triparma columacea TaxID=722753 RepID=A0A9W7L2X4_9STRA|nr:hypothetical protein TrCOL_g8642 [Triparma columacea]